MKNRFEELETLVSQFIRPLPPGTNYSNRLEQELELIVQLNFAKHFLRVREILDLTRDIPHITRGSAGSSLICWMMGISDVDPIAENIPLSRFMNPKRDDLPDIDLDFPHWQQEEVMNRIYRRWPGQSARVSNYVTYKEKSARREAAKRLGASGKLDRNFTFEQVVPDYVDDAERLANKLLGASGGFENVAGMLGKAVAPAALSWSTTPRIAGTLSTAKRTSVLSTTKSTRNSPTAPSACIYPRRVA